MSDKIAGFMFEGMGVPRLGKYLDVTAFRQKLISGNVANVSTPGYKAGDIDFQSEFDRVTQVGNRLAGAVTHHSHLPLGNHSARAPEVELADLEEGELTSVDIDEEISDLTQNQLRFTIGATLLKQKFEGLHKAITSK